MIKCENWFNTNIASPGWVSNYGKIIVFIEIIVFLEDSANFYKPICNTGHISKRAYW